MTSSPNRLDLLFDGLPIVAHEFIGHRRDAWLYDDEMLAVANAVPSRRSEFAAGRTCARSALADLGFGRPSIPVGAHREPIWPSGTIGSISHTTNYCLAAVCRAGGAVRGLGVDAERRGRIPTDIFGLLFSRDERRHISSGTSSGDADARATRMFSAKESFFKAQFPLTRRWIGFHDVAAVMGPRTGELLLSAVDERLREDFPTPVEAKWMEYGDLVITAVTVVD